MSAERFVIAFDIGLKNLAYCIMVKTDSGMSIRSLEVVDLGCRKTDTQKIIEAVIDLLDNLLYTELDEVVAGGKPLTVLIESQMTSLMKCIQTAINTFFKVTARYTSLDVVTKYMSAKHKLALVARYPDFTKAPSKKVVSKYKQNKQDSIEFALWHLENHAKNMEVYQKVKSAKKADDLCDSYLMALYFVETGTL